MVCCAWMYWIGVATTCYFAAKLLAFIHQYWVMRTPISKFKKAGQWAVVTGASDGIGKAMSVELGRRGFNVCLVSRTKSKLDEAAALVTEKSGVQTKTIAFDFSTAGDAEYSRLFKELDQIEVGVLINNVGINYAYPEDIDAAELALDMNIIKVNCEAQVRMTRYVVPRMKAKKSGAILNLSSISCCAPTPLLSIYAATKSFNKAYSESLAVELKPFGIAVTAVTPAFVCSNMSGRKKPTFDCPSAPAMAANTLNQLGGVATTFGHRHHGIIGAVLTSLPAFIRDPQILKANKTVRVKAIKKAEREKAAKAAQ